MPNSILLTPTFCRQNLFVSITFSSRDNFTILKHFVPICSLIFLSSDPPFFPFFLKIVSTPHFLKLTLDFWSSDPLFYCSLIFLTPHFYNIFDLIGSILSSCSGHPCRKCCEEPPPPPLQGFQSPFVKIPSSQFKITKKC